MKVLFGAGPQSSYSRAGRTRWISLVLILLSVFTLTSCKLTVSEGDGFKTGNSSPTSSTIEKDSYRFKIITFDIWKKGDRSYYRAIVEFKNTGEDNFYFAPSQFVLEDGAGNIFQVDEATSYPQVVKPGEKAYLYNAFLEREIDSSIRVGEVRLRPEFELKKTDIEPRSFEIRGTELKEDHSIIKLEGRVVNQSGDDDVTIRVNVVYFDSANRILEIADDKVFYLKAGEEGSFEFSSFDLAEKVGLKGIASYEIRAVEDFILD